MPLHSIVNRERLNQCVYRFIPLISPFVECLACLRACVGAGGWVCDPDMVFTKLEKRPPQRNPDLDGTTMELWQ